MDNEKFYTKPDVAEACWTYTKTFLKHLQTVDLYIEPSAGNGSFLKLLPSDYPNVYRIGLDIDPDDKEITKKNFFHYTTKMIADNVLVIGNPPFGKRGRTAIEFFNHAATMADTVAFIVPVNFRKFMVHRQLNSSMDLIGQMPLQRNSFFLPSGGDYEINTEFQVWTRQSVPMKNLRRFQSEPTSHVDFEMWQYNNTDEALKFFKNDFHFAVPCQGWQDYSRKETDADKCEKNKQWILIKARSPEALNALHMIDFENLAMSCSTIVPGFRKRDVVEAYCALEHE